MKKWNPASHGSSRLRMERLVRQGDELRKAFRLILGVDDDAKGT